ncbi:MAG: hypothetical protein IPL88_02345 [Rhizobiales bacterium]|nr:hypothetical protein [Hyphomicrobiales bacterium]
MIRVTSVPARRRVYGAFCDRSTRQNGPLKRGQKIANLDLPETPAAAPAPLFQRAAE